MIQYINPSKDVFVYEYNPYTNYEGSQYLYVGNSGGVGTNYKSFLYFDLSAIPASNSVSSANLKLYVTTKSIVGPVTVTAYQLNGPFNSEYLTWNSAINIIGVATTDNVTINGTQQYFSIDITDLASQWVSNAATNYGLCIQINSVVTGYVAFGSNNNNVQLYRPVLEITTNDSQMESESIISGNFQIDTSTSIIEGTKIATTHAIDNLGTTAVDNGMGVIQLNYNNKWYDEKGTNIYAGSTKTMSTWAARNQERLTILSAKGSTLYSFVPQGQATTYSLNNNIQVNNTESPLTQSYNNQVALNYSESGGGGLNPLVISPNGTVTVPTELDLSDPVTRTIDITTRNLGNECNSLSLTFNNQLVSSANAGQIGTALSSQGIGATNNITIANSATVVGESVRISNQYANFLSGINQTVKNDILVESNRSLAGLNVDIYYSNSNENYVLVKSNQQLTGTSFYLSQLLGIQPPTLASKNGVTDNYQIVINQVPTLDIISYELSISTIAGTLNGAIINPSNMKYLNQNPTVVLIIQ